MDILIKNARVIDPANKIDEAQDLLIQKGKIIKLAKNITEKKAKQVNAENMIIAPGLFDMHTHLREPGKEDAEDIRTAALAAAKGGYTSITAMPNTSPPCDGRGIVEYINTQAAKESIVNVFVTGAITKQQQGEELTEMADMQQAGITAVTDDGFFVANSQLMRKALEYAKMLNLLVISHCEDISLCKNGVMNEGITSTKLGLKGIPSAAESIALARDILLADYTKTKLHIAHVSAKESVELIRYAKKEKINITAETCPHYFSLTEEAVKDYNTNTKVNPPLRTEKDRQAIIRGLQEGIIDVISTDHAPHTQASKDLEYDYAPFGMIGLETALALAVDELVKTKKISWNELIQKMSFSPAQILKQPLKGNLAPGNDADIVIINPDKKWVFDINSIQSKSKNTPFIGREFTSCVEATICKGSIIYHNETFKV